MQGMQVHSTGHSFTQPGIFLFLFRENFAGLYRYGTEIMIDTWVDEPLKMKTIKLQTKPGSLKDSHDSEMQMLVLSYLAISKYLLTDGRYLLVLERESM